MGRMAARVAKETHEGSSSHAARGAAVATGTTVTIDRYGEYRDGVTLGTLQELMFAYVTQLGATKRRPRTVAPGWV